MAGDAFSLTGRTLTRLAAAVAEQAERLEFAIRPFEDGAIVGMAEAWGPAGETTRGPYLEYARAVVPQLEAMVQMLRSVAEQLEASFEASQAADRAAAHAFDQILRGEA